MIYKIIDICASGKVLPSADKMIICRLCNRTVELKNTNYIGWEIV